MTETEAQRAAWTDRVEYYAREAAPKMLPFAMALVDAVNLAAGAKVLDVATGPGIVAVEAARRVGPHGAVLATDFVPDWAPHVAANAAAAGVANVTFAVMAAEELPLPDESFDAVLCQFGLMFVPEPHRALAEMRRVLRPGGTLGVTVWSTPENVGVFLISRIVAAALDQPAAGSSLSPTGMSAPGLLDSLLADAGFREIEVQMVTRTFEIAEAEAEWRRAAEGPGAPLAPGLASLAPAVRERVYQEAITALEALRQEDRIVVPSEAIQATARR